jgi:hypothetical protein
MTSSSGRGRRARRTLPGGGAVSARGPGGTRHRPAGWGGRPGTAPDGFAPGGPRLRPAAHPWGVAPPAAPAPRARSARRAGTAPETTSRHHSDGARFVDRGATPRTERGRTAARVNQPRAGLKLYMLAEVPSERPAAALHAGHALRAQIRDKLTFDHATFALVAAQKIKACRLKLRWDYISRRPMSLKGLKAWPSV